jgi:hypothetical protein
MSKNGRMSKYYKKTKLGLEALKKEKQQRPIIK